MILAQAEQVVKLVDHAASMTDRWVMLALLVIILGSSFYIVRHLLTTAREQQEAHGKAMAEQQAAHAKAMADLQNTHQNFVTTLFKESVQIMAQATVTISENTLALREVKDALDDIRKSK